MLLAALLFIQPISGFGDYKPCEEAGIPYTHNLISCERMARAEEVYIFQNGNGPMLIREDGSGYWTGYSLTLVKSEDGSWWIATEGAYDERLGKGFDYRTSRLLYKLSDEDRKSIGSRLEALGDTLTSGKFSDMQNYDPNPKNIECTDTSDISLFVRTPNQTYSVAHTDCWRTLVHDGAEEILDIVLDIVPAQAEYLRGSIQPHRDFNGAE